MRIHLSSALPLLLIHGLAVGPAAAAPAADTLNPAAQPLLLLGRMPAEPAPCASLVTVCGELRLGPHAFQLRESAISQELDGTIRITATAAWRVSSSPALHQSELLIQLPRQPLPFPVAQPQSIPDSRPARRDPVAQAKGNAARHPSLARHSLKDLAEAMLAEEGGSALMDPPLLPCRP